jgi:hypothetical protein
MFKTSTEDQTVHLTNKIMTKDSERFSLWFHRHTVCEEQPERSCEIQYRWIHESSDLWWYVWGCVCSGTSYQKHYATWFTRSFSALVFSALTDMRSEKHSYYELWCVPIKNTRSNRQHHCFWFLTLYVELHFHTLWNTYRTCSWSKHESLSTNLRNRVISTHSDSTPDCPDPFTTPRSHFLPTFTFPLVSPSIVNETYGISSCSNFQKTVFIWLRQGTWNTGNLSYCLFVPGRNPVYHMIH